MTSDDDDEQTQIDEAPPVRAPAFLVVLQGLTAGDVVQLDRSVCLIGRAEEADLRLPDRGVSSIHAVVSVDGNGDVSIQDLGSTNGTHVNGRLLSGTRPLVDSDKIAMGVTAILKFTLDAGVKDAMARQAAENRGRDPLTGAYQDAHFKPRFEEEFANARRHTTPLAIAVISIDAFHELRLNHGQEAADEVLAEFGRRTRKILTSEHLFARTGRWTFTVLLRSLTTPEACIFIERIRKAVSASPIAAGGRAFAVTISAGVAAIPFEGIDSPQQLIRLADLGLMDAKETHNCVVPTKAKPDT